MKTTYVLFFCLLFVALSACNPRLWCDRNYPPIEKIEVMDTTIYLKGDLVRDTISFEKLNTIEKNTVIVDSVGKAKLSYYVDAYNRLIMNCESKPDTVFVPRIKETIVKETCSKEGTPSWAYWVIGFCVATIVALAIKVVLRFFL